MNGSENGDRSSHSPMSTRSGAWWPVSLSEQVGTDKPKAVFIDDEPIVLFRDLQGTIRALENRCPHRRAPLALGTVRPEGWIQCGYHGWSFDGATGKCKAIPNLRGNEPVPSTYGVFAYRTAEHLDMIYVATDIAEKTPPAAFYGADILDTATHPRSGDLVVGLAHGEYIAALMDGPHRLLRSPGIRIADTVAIDPHWQDDWLVMERPAFWLGQSTFDAFVREYKLLFRLAIHRDTGESWLAFVHPDESVICAAHWGIAPSARGTTKISWRSFASAAPGVRPVLLRAAAALGVSPIEPRRDIDMASVAALLVGPSEHLPRHRHTAGLFGETLNQRRAAI
jgi:nitrite reductase/ring-hydroxylating ferredoxin subunit